MTTYAWRIVDDVLDVLMGLPALAIEGAKGVGKTATATRRAATVLRLDTRVEQALIAADPERLGRLPEPILLDEWQYYPDCWDLVRRQVDDRPEPGRFLLTGSATPTERPTHSGAGRIARVRMRPLSLAERQTWETPRISLSALLGGAADVLGETTADLAWYAGEVLDSGFPGIRSLGDSRLRSAQLDGYLDRIVDAEFALLGHRLRQPTVLASWLRAYAAATSSTASYTAILNAATPGERDKPARNTATAYRDILTRLWILDPVPAWVPTGSPLARLAHGPKHHLADPALAARLLGVSAASLSRDDPTRPGDQTSEPLLGPLFESLVTLSIKTYAEAARARVYHLRTARGDHEVDLIVEGDDRRVVAVEVKLGPHVSDRDVAHLRWLKERLGHRIADLVVVTTGRTAYRRADGVAVVPAALLGP